MLRLAGVANAALGHARPLNLSRLQPHLAAPASVLLAQRPALCWRQYSSHGDLDRGRAQPQPKLGLVARFKQMYKDYWYVLVPVHIVTSAAWLGSFYYLAKSGVDVVALLKSIGLSEKFTDPLKDSSLGHVALAYALYKVATPVRYTVTLGGTTISIKYLQSWGYLKPMPSKAALKEMYQEKKESFQEKYNETKEELKQRKDQICERKDHVMSDIARYKQEIKDIKQSELKSKDV